MTEATGFFDSYTVGPQRDRWGRPLLVPRGGTDADREPYTRASSLSSNISDMRYLHEWEKRKLARGLSERPDYAALIASQPKITGNKKVDRVTTQAVDEVIRRAMDQGETWAAADHGTAVHSLTDPGASGHVPEQMRADVDSFHEAMKSFPILATEVFIACDDVRAAGTFDHVVQLPPYGNVIADKKTGKLRPQEFAVQLAVYAHGDIYDTQTDTRTPLDVNQDTGLIIHIAGGKTDLYIVDLVAGWEAAQHAAWVRDYHRNKDLLMPIPDMATLAFLNAKYLISQAKCRQDLSDIYAAHQHVWTFELTELGNRRLAEIGAA